MSDCIFCQIATGKIQGLRVFEDEKTLAIMDIAKDVDGHMLVIPKKHCKNILDCDRETLNAVMDTVRKVSRHLTEKCGYDGVNLLNASGESAGQSVPHFHIHINNHAGAAPAQIGMKTGRRITARLPVLQSA